MPMCPSFTATIPAFPLLFPMLPQFRPSISHRLLLLFPPLFLVPLSLTVCTCLCMLFIAPCYPRIPCVPRIPRVPHLSLYSSCSSYFLVFLVFLVSLVFFVFLVFPRIPRIPCIPRIVYVCPRVLILPISVLFPMLSPRLMSLS